MWVKLDDGFFDNPKVAAAGPMGAVLYLASLCYSARALTDGWIPDGQVPVLVAQVKATKALVRKVIDSGLWEQGVGGYLVPDFLEFNRSRDDVMAERLSARERRSKGGRTSREPPDDVRANDSLSVDNPVPSPLTRDPFVDDFDAVWAQYPRKVARKQAFKAYQARRRSGVDADELARAVEHYAEDCEAEARETRYRMHGASFFGPNERWKDYLEERPNLTPAPALGPEPVPVPTRPDCLECGGTGMVFDGPAEARRCSSCAKAAMA